MVRHLPAGLEPPGATRLHQDDAAAFDAGQERIDIVSCLGAASIGGSLAGTIDLMRRRVLPAGLLLVGEVFWQAVPAEGEDLVGSPGDFGTLGETVRRCESAGDEVVAMVIADHGDWDRHQASQWLATEL